MLVESFSGVRGVFGRDLDAALCQRYARALEEFLGPGKIVVGRDTRPSGEELHDAVLSELSSPVDVGVASIPAIQQAVRSCGAVGGIAITASHNEPEFNGLKLLRSDGGLLSADDMARVIALSKTVSLVYPGAIAETFDALEAYAAFVHEVVGDLTFIQAPVVLDPNGGTACAYPAVLESLGVSTLVVNAVPGVFARLVEPNASSLAPLKEIVVSSGALFAAGFDCDADRVELVLTDRLVSGNEVLALVVKEVLSPLPAGQTVVVNDATSQMVSAVVHAHGSHVVECPVGEINVVDAMIAADAVVGGEGSSSGAIVFPSRCRDGLVSLLLVLRYLARTGESLAQAVASLPLFVSVRKNMVLSSVQAAKAREAFIEWGQTSGGHVVVGDAVKVVFADSFAWMRQSQTEHGVVRVICDAPSEEQARELLAVACACLDSIK